MAKQEWSKERRAKQSRIVKNAWKQRRNSGNEPERSVNEQRLVRLTAQMIRLLPDERLVELVDRGNK